MFSLCLLQQGEEAGPSGCVMQTHSTNSRQKDLTQSWTLGFRLTALMMWWSTCWRMKVEREAELTHIQTKFCFFHSFPVTTVMISIFIDAWYSSPWAQREIEINCPTITIANVKLVKYHQESLYLVFYFSEQTNCLGFHNTLFSPPISPQTLYITPTQIPLQWGFQELNSKT